MDNFQPLVVTLTGDERQSGIEFAKGIHRRAVEFGYAESNLVTTDKEQEDADILAHLARMAVAKAVGIALDENRYRHFYHGSDLDPDIKVRARSKHFRDLIVRDGDASYNLILVTSVDLSEFHIHGWFPGSGHMDQDWRGKNNGRICWYVPRRVLFPLAELPGLSADVIQQFMKRPA